MPKTPEELEGERVEAERVAALTKVETKVETIAGKIDEAANSEEVEPKWVASLSSALTTLTAEVIALKKAQGASPELAELMRELAELRQTIATLPPSLPPSSVAAVAPSPETPPEKSSETPPAPSPTPEPSPAPISAKASRKKEWL